MPERSRAATLLLSVLVCLAAAACGHGTNRAAESAGPFDLGQPATARAIAALDIDVAPDGRGLPAGRGTAAAGASLFATSCERCHGTAVALDPNRWPYATTLFDYVRRAMPPVRGKALSDPDVYALVAYELAVNGFIARDDIMDKETLPRVRMPNRARFVDNR